MHAQAPLNLDILLAIADLCIRQLKLVPLQLCMCESTSESVQSIVTPQAARELAACIMKARQLRH